jgi:hypothetical protein
MVTKEEMLKGLDAYEELINAQAQLGKDGLIFIFENNLWEKFMKYHAKKHVERI